MVRVRPEGPSWGLSRREETGGGGRVGSEARRGQHTHLTLTLQHGGFSSRPKRPSGFLSLPPTPTVPERPWATPKLRA